VCVCARVLGGGGVDGVSWSQGDGSPQGCLVNFFPEQEWGEEQEEREREKEKEGERGGWRLVDRVTWERRGSWVRFGHWQVPLTWQLSTPYHPRIIPHPTSSIFTHMMFLWHYTEGLR